MADDNERSAYFKIRNTLNDLAKSVEQVVKDKKEQYRNKLPASLSLEQLTSLEEESRNICNQIDADLNSGLEKVIQKIEDYLNENFPFKGKIIPIGSYIDGTKIAPLDEFDYLFVCDDDISFEKLPSQDTYKIYYKDQELKASAIAEEFTNTIDKIGASLKSTDSVLTNGGFASPLYSGCRRNGPATTLLFHRNVLISVDLTIAFQLKPTEEKDILAQVDLNARALFGVIGMGARDLLQGTICLVPVHPDKDDWHISTASLESKLIASLPSDSAMKIAIRYGKIVSSKQVAGIQFGAPGMVNILTDLVPTTVIEKNLHDYHTKKNISTLPSLRNQMRHAHIYLTEPLGKQFNELASSIVKIDSASIKHMVLRIVCVDYPQLASARGHDMALRILEHIMRKTAEVGFYYVQNFLYPTKIKMFSVSGYAASSWFDLTCIAKLRCEQFLESLNQRSNTPELSGTFGWLRYMPSAGLISKCAIAIWQMKDKGLSKNCPRCYGYQLQLLQLYQKQKEVVQNIEAVIRRQQGSSGRHEQPDDQQPDVPNAYVEGIGNNAEDTELSSKPPELSEESCAGETPKEQMNKLCDATLKKQLGKDHPQLLWQIDLDENLESLKFSHEGYLLAVVGNGVNCFTRNGKPLHSPMSSLEHITDIAVDHKTLTTVLTNLKEKTFAVYSLSSNQKPQTKHETRFHPWLVAFTADGNLIINTNRARSFKDGLIYEYTLDGHMRWKKTLPFVCHSLAVNGWNIFASDQKKVHVYAYGKKYKPLFTFPHGADHGRLRSPRGLCVDSLGHLLICDSILRKVTLWNGRGEYMKDLVKLSIEPEKLALFEDRWLAIASLRTIQMYDLQNGNL